MLLTDIQSRFLNCLSNLLHIPYLGQDQELQVGLMHVRTSPTSANITLGIFSPTQGQVYVFLYGVTMKPMAVMNIVVIYGNVTIPINVSAAPDNHQDKFLQDALKSSLLAMLQEQGDIRDKELEMLRKQAEDQNLARWN